MALRRPTPALCEAAVDLFLQDRWRRLTMDHNSYFLRLLEDCAGCLQIMQPSRRDLVFLEVSDGVSISEEASAYGPAMPFADQFGDNQCITTEAGYTYLLSLALRLQEGSTMWISPKTFTWMSGALHSHSRKTDAIDGNREVPEISEENLRAERLATVGTIAWLRGAHQA